MDKTDGLVDVVYAYTLDKNALQLLTHNDSDIESVKETYINTGFGWDADPNVQGVQASTAYVPRDYIYDYVSNGGSNTGSARYNRTETVRSRLVDVNGDGLVDWVRAYHTWAPNQEHKATWLNTGSGWTSNAAYKMPDVFAEHKGEFSLGHGQFVDLNGDGLPDWLQAYHRNSEPSATLAAWINTGDKSGGVGSAWRNDNSYKLPEAIFDNRSGWDSPIQKGSMVDVNGDGRRDWVRSYITSGGALNQKTWLNTGDGWVNSTAYKPPFIQFNNRYASKTNDHGQSWGLQITGNYVDINRDGLVDYAQSYKDHDGVSHKKTWLNTGIGWDGGSSGLHPNRLFYDYSGRGDGITRFGSFLDINTDTGVDWVEARKDFTLRTQSNKVKKTDLITKVTTTMGVEVKPTFLPLTNNDQLYTQRPLDGGLLMTAQEDSYFMEAPICVVAELNVSSPDGLGDRTTRYQYGGAQIHRKGRGYLGFATRSSIDVQKNIRVNESFHQDFPRVGLTFWKTVVHNDERISDTVNRYSRGIKFYFPSTSRHDGVDHLPLYAAMRLAGTAYNVPLLQNTITENYGLNGGQAYQAVYKQFDYDYANNVLQSYTKTGTHVNTNGDLQGIQNETWVDQTYERSTTNLAQYLTKTSKVTTSAPNKPTIVRNSSFTYTPKGQLDIETRESNGAANIKLRTDYDYDGYGNVIKQILISNEADEPNRITRITYDARHRLPIKTTNAVGHVARTTYHAQCDQPATATDANNLQTTFTYDNFCRQKTATNVATGVTATNTYTHPSTALASSCGSFCQTTAKFKTTSKTTGQPAVHTYYNRFNQPLMVETSGMLGETIRQQTEYDRFGRASRTSQPYFASDLPLWTTQTYDVLDRPYNTTLPYTKANGQSAVLTNRYSVDTSHRQKTVSRNALTRPKTTITNAIGQVVEVKDAYQKSMTYAYDSQGNLIGTTDALGNSIVVGYDLLGRRTSLDDPDLGLSTFTYNAFGEQRSQTDAKGQVISSEYDMLGRMKKRTVTDSNSLAEVSRWVYDTAANGKGALHQVFGPNGYKELHSYDIQGRPRTVTTTILGQNYQQTLSYNANGQLASKRYPDSGAGHAFVVNYQYQNGFLSSINSDETDQGHCIEHWRAEKYDALGRLNEERLGKIISSTRDFKAGQGVLEQIQSSLLVNDANTVQDLNYNYDANNNLLRRENALTSTVENFDYDFLDRITEHVTGGNTIETHYDWLGNVIYKSDVGSYAYDAAQPHAVSKVSLPFGVDPGGRFDTTIEWNGQTYSTALPSVHGNGQFSYDANGNVIRSGDRIIEWTAFNKPARIAKSGGLTSTGANFHYNADFKRIVKQKDDGEITIYIGKEYEKITKSGEVLHRYTFTAGSHRIQIEREDGASRDKPSYHLADHLGSTQVIIDSEGKLAQEQGYDAWGNRTNVGDASAVNSITNKGYTGHEMDDEVGLINMNARIYDPYLGRFLSADPVLQAPFNMQSYNRYSYVWNNPLKYTDPTGNRCAGCSGGGGVDSVSEGRFFTFFFGIPNIGGPSPIFDVDEIERAVQRQGVEEGWTVEQTDAQFIYTLQGMRDKPQTDPTGFFGGATEGNVSSQATPGDSHQNSVEVDAAIDNALEQPESIFDKVGLPTKRNTAKRTRENRDQYCSPNCNDGGVSPELAEIFILVTGATVGAGGVGKVSSIPGVVGESVDAASRAAAVLSKGTQQARRGLDKIMSNSERTKKVCGLALSLCNFTPGGNGGLYHDPADNVIDAIKRIEKINRRTEVETSIVPIK